MSQTLKAVRGTRDLLPPQTEIWEHIEVTARSVFARYGFGEIRTPIFEDTQLFARGVGEETDIVSKEMFTWEDERVPLTLRLRAAWLRENAGRIGVGQFDSPIAVRPVISALALDGSPTIVEYRVDPPARVGRKLQNRVTRARSSGQEQYVVVVPRSRAQKLDSQSYASAGIKLELIAGSFESKPQSLTLRPENTAGVVRAYIEHKLGESGRLQKLYYIGPQFRRERPQKGRYRQFWQIGAEVIGAPSSGSESPVRDAEVLEMLATYLDELGIRNWKLAINSVGSATDRPRYIAALREALQPVKAQMCGDCQRRADTNPLRVLDCKHPEDQSILATLPKIADYLDEASRAHFSAVLAALDACGVPYEVNPRLVRGLDYYTRTTFEFLMESGELGSQNALLGGGRYDGLSESLGGPRAPGIGFAIGEDRLVLILEALREKETAGAHIAQKADAYIAPLGDAQNPAALKLARDLRRAGLRIELGDGSFRLKKSFDTADAVARHIVILGEDEVAKGEATVKTFATGEQKKVPFAELAAQLRTA